MIEPKPRYQPTSVQDATDYDPLKGTIRVKRVNYRLHDGTNSYIIVPLDEYTKEKVEKMLEKAASEHDEVMEIKGAPHMRMNAANPWEQTG